MKEKFVQKSNITMAIYCFIIIITCLFTYSCSNNSHAEKMVATTSENKNDGVIVITGRWEEVKKNEVVNEDTLPQENTFIFIFGNRTITKVENNLIVYTFVLSDGDNNRTYSFNEGANNVYVKNDSILSIKYDQDGKEEVYKQTHTLIEYLRSKHVKN